MHAERPGSKEIRPPCETAVTFASDGVDEGAWIAHWIFVPRFGSSSGGLAVSVPPGRPSLVGPTVGELRLFDD